MISQKLIVQSIVDERIPVKRSELMKRIRDMVAIVTDCVEAQEYLPLLPWITIPYYAVGVDDEMVQELRTYFANMIFNATFNASMDREIAGLYVAAVEKSEKILNWLATRPPVLTQAERDFLSEFCNPIYINASGRLDLAAWSANAYINGQYVYGAVTTSRMKEMLNFFDDYHRIEWD